MNVSCGITVEYYLLRDIFRYIALFWIEDVLVIAAQVLRGAT
jgi:hypothetical protein